MTLTQTIIYRVALGFAIQQALDCIYLSYSVKSGRYVQIETIKIYYITHHSFFSLYSM